MTIYGYVKNICSRFLLMLRDSLLHLNHLDTLSTSQLRVVVKVLRFLCE